MPTSLIKKYKEEIVPSLKKQFKYKNLLETPKLEKIVLNMGVGKTLENKRRLECAVRDMGLIAGQKPVITKAKKSIAGFKLREGMNIGCKVTLRQEIMYEFLERLITVAIPRIRDFRGLGRDSFDQWGNYSLGICDETIFPEVNMDRAEFTQGMNVTIVIKNSSKEASRELLRLFGMPFKNEEESNG